MHRPLAVAEHLHLDVAGGGDVFLDQHGGVAEGRLRLALGAGKRLGEALGRVDPAHPLAAAARHGLDEHRIADPVRLGGQMRRVLVLAVIAGDDRDARLLHQRLGGVLEAHGADRLGRGADEDQPRRLDRIHELGVLGQEAVARVDRLGAGRQRRLDDRIAAQVAVLGRRAADVDRLVGQRHVARAAVGVGIDGHGRHPHPAAAVHDAAGDLAAVGDQDLAEHGVPLVTAQDPGRRPGPRRMWIETQPARLTSATRG